MMPSDTRTGFAAGPAAAALALAAALSPPAVAQCPPGTFDYGPTSDPFYAQIVIDHHGPSGPLLPPVAEYERAQRDVPLIRQALPALAQIGHQGSRPYPPVLFAHVPSTWPTLPQEVLCANEYYRVEARARTNWPSYRFTFPAPINADAIAAVYAQLPGITRVEVNDWGCAGCCEAQAWEYEPLPGGTWRWTVRDVWFRVRSCYSVAWTIDVSVDGIVSLVSRPCFADCDNNGTLDFHDFLCFQDAFLAGSRQADCDGDGQFTFFDFLCFQDQFLAGCP